MKINHLTITGLVLGMLTGSYSRAWAEYAFARQIVDFTMAASPTTAIAAPTSFTGTLNDSATGNTFFFGSPGFNGNSVSFNNNSAFPVNITQAFGTDTSSIMAPPENTFGPAGSLGLGEYARADGQVAMVGQNAGGAIEAIASLVAEASVRGPFPPFEPVSPYQALGSATWNVTIPFSLTATSSLSLSASVPAAPDSSGPGVILSAFSFPSTFASDSFTAILTNSVGGTIFTWTPAHLNEKIIGGNNDMFSGLLQTNTQTVAAGSYTLTLSAGVVAFASPEPASIVTAGMGLLGVLGIHAWRRFSTGVLAR
jgi:hypothetical protein